MNELVNCVYMTILHYVDATVCDPPCVNGACIGNNICSCYEDGLVTLVAMKVY